MKIFNSDLLNNIDLVFLALHGKWGEDGIIQSLLELRGINYTGSGVLSIFQKNNVNTAAWFTVANRYKIDDVIKTIKTEFSYPCVVKPNDQGSTVGMTILKKDDELKNAIELALSFSDLALVEEYIPGREMTVAILDDKPLPVLEIIPKDGFYNYESKYTEGMSEYIVPADIPEYVFRNLQGQAVKAFHSLRCKIYGRVDFRLNEDNISYCLEVNTLPGMTSTSLVPKMAKAIGISFEELIDKIIRNSLDGKK